MDQSLAFTNGIAGGALCVGSGDAGPVLTVDAADLPLAGDHSFSVQCWVRTSARPGQRFVVLSKKPFPDTSLASQKQAGWAFYVSGGTWAWNMGSGDRRLTYERDNAGTEGNTG